MVGNRISTDILGGNKMGMKTVLIKWSSRHQEKVTCELEKPSYTIHSLNELIPIIKKLGEDIPISAILFDLSDILIEETSSVLNTARLL